MSDYDKLKYIQDNIPVSQDPVPLATGLLIDTDGQPVSGPIITAGKTMGRHQM